MTQLFYLSPTMYWPLVACLVLTGIHVYLGVHVIARKVIFVDLALAQIAALGTVIGVLLGYEVGTNTTALYLYSLAFTIFGAFVFSITRMRGEKIPHEAIIGIVYAVTFASTILVLSKSALGPQELDHIIKGELLWVQPATVIKTAIIYLLVGAFHFIFRKKFMAISFDMQKAEDSGMKVRFWDFLFYMSFGFVITSSVAIAGVFLVFSYLVIPSVGAMLLSNKLSTRLAIGWIGGSVISFIGVKLSYTTGLPTSPAIVVVLASGLLLCGIIYHIKHSERLLIALRDLGFAFLVVVIFISGIWYFRKADEDPLEHTMHRLGSQLSTERTAALADLQGFADSKYIWLPRVIDRLRDSDAEVRQSAVELLGKLGERSAATQAAELLKDPVDDVRKSALETIKRIGGEQFAGRLLDLGTHETDPELQVEYLGAALSLGSADALPKLAGILEEGGVFADDAYASIRKHVAFEFQRTEGKRLMAWWEQHHQQLQWNSAAAMYSLKN
jgi:zinc/manganese transport system permease protein